MECRQPFNQEAEFGLNSSQTIYLAPVAWAAVLSGVVILLKFNHYLLLLPLFLFV